MYTRARAVRRRSPTSSSSGAIAPTARRSPSARPSCRCCATTSRRWTAGIARARSARASRGRAAARSAQILAHGPAAARRRSRATTRTTPTAARSAHSPASSGRAPARPGQSGRGIRHRRRRRPPLVAAAPEPSPIAPRGRTRRWPRDRRARRAERRRADGSEAARSSSARSASWPAPVEIVHAGHRSGQARPGRDRRAGWSGAGGSDSSASRIRDAASCCAASSA